jgi:hypothetical protein
MDLKESAMPSWHREVLPTASSVPFYSTKDSTYRVHRSGVNSSDASGINSSTRIWKRKVQSAVLCQE